MNREIVRLMFKESILHNIFQKLAVYNRNPVIQLSLLRLLKILLIEGKGTSLFNEVSYQVIERLQELDAKNSVLIEELIQEIGSIVQTKE
jgi:cell division control protein CDC15